MDKLTGMVTEKESEQGVRGSGRTEEHKVKVSEMKTERG